MATGEDTCDTNDFGSDIGTSGCSGGESDSLTARILLYNEFH